MKAKQIQAEAIANTEQVIAPAAESPYAPRRWQFDSRRIYLRPRTRPQSARGVAAGSQVHIAQSSCAMGQTDRQIALSLNAPELSMGPFSMTRSNPTHQLTDPTQPNPWVNPTRGQLWLLLTSFTVISLCLGTTVLKTVPVW